MPQQIAMCSALSAFLLLASAVESPSIASPDDRHIGRFDVTDFAPPGRKVDVTGEEDASGALERAVLAANTVTATGKPACVHLPSGIFRVRRPPPPFRRAGCIAGEGSSQSIIRLDKSFAGDLFSWSEAWAETTPGPRIVGLSVVGEPGSSRQQNAFVFYDRNDELFMEDVTVRDVHGRAFYSGATKQTPQGYLRESMLRGLRFFRDGAPGVPVVEFVSKGSGATDATNEIQLSQINIYAAKGPSFVIRNDGDGLVRDIMVDQLRIEGEENGTTAADLLVVGDANMRGNVANITFTSLELLDPYKGFAALHIFAPIGRPAPYQITVAGEIGGGLPRGQGLRIDAGRTSTFRMSGIHTTDTNVVIGRGVSQIVLDGGGQERHWTYKIDPTSLPGISTPERHQGDPSDSQAASRQAQ